MQMFGDEIWLKLSKKKKKGVELYNKILHPDLVHEVWPSNDLRWVCEVGVYEWSDLT